MRYCIIGNSAAAIGAVESIRQYDAKNSILLIAHEPYHTYSRPLISYFLAGVKKEENMRYRPKDFYQKNNVEVKLGKKAVFLDTEGEQVILEGNEKVTYDRLLLATGGKPFVPPVKGLEELHGDGIHTFIKLDDAKELKKDAVPGKKAVIVGAGLIGLKAAEGLVKREVDVTVIDLAPHILGSILDESAAQLVQQHLESKGIQFYLGTTAEAITRSGKGKTVSLADGTELAADIVVMAVGVVPNTDLVKQTGIKVNRGIVTDDHMRTSVDGIYAAGDVAENYDLLLRQNRVIPILPNAYQQGRVAGANMTGEDVVYPGGFPKNAIGFFGLPMVTAGLLKDPDAKEYVKQAEDKYLKLLVKDGRLVGFIRINAVDRSGILTGLMLEQADISDIIDQLLNSDPGLIVLPGETRRSRLQGGVVEWR